MFRCFRPKVKVARNAHASPELTQTAPPPVVEDSKPPEPVVTEKLDVATEARTVEAAPVLAEAPAPLETPAAVNPPSEEQPTIQPDPLKPLPVTRSKGRAVLSRLVEFITTPLLGLLQATELISSELEVDLCSIHGISTTTTSAVLLAATGKGAAHLEAQPVLQGPAWSTAAIVSSREGKSATIETEADADILPRDWQQLAKLAELRSFLSMPIATGDVVLGVLTVASTQPHAFDELWEDVVDVLAVGILTSLRMEAMQYITRILEAMDLAEQPQDFIGLLLQGTRSFLFQTSNLDISCRLALINSNLSKALIFETSTDEEGGSGSQASNSPPAHDVHITELPLANTLLLDAVTKGRARFVSDCTSYLHSCVHPAGDIFISSSRPIASIVVLPLIYGGTVLGALYFTKDSASNFQVMKNMLLGLVNVMAFNVNNRLGSIIETVWDNLMARQSVDGSPALEGGGGAAAAGGHGSSDGPQAGGGMELVPSARGDAADNANALAPAVAAGSGALSPINASTTTASTTRGGALGPRVYVKRSCTESMVQVLQQEIRKGSTKKRAGQQEWVEDLVLTELVGKGGFGVVYKGMYRGAVAAVKVMYARQHERQAMKDALEMAVLTSISHPNIIQVYACLTNMVEDAGGHGQSVGGQGVNVKFRRLQPEEDGSLATCNVVVMEYCDRGSLRQAIKRGLFHKRIGQSSVAVDLCGIITTLLEVASAIRHLHDHNLVHSDIKPENVLLKLDPNRPGGFVTKLTDFGLTKLLRDSYYVINRSGSGTVTHLAPELFQAGTKITTAVDAYSFGIMMWEMYTGQRAYSGMAREAIVDRVYKHQGRPMFPPGCPPAYVELASELWAADYHARPVFKDVIGRLQQMLAAFQSSMAAQAAATAAAGGAQAAAPPVAPPGLVAAAQVVG